MNKTYNPECDPDYERDPENPNYPESWNVVAGQEEFITENAAGVEFNKNELDLIRELLLVQANPSGSLKLPVPNPTAESAYQKVCRLQEMALEVRVSK